MARAAVFGLLLVLVLSAPRPASSRPCTCDDIDDLKATLEMIDETRRAWYGVLAEIYRQTNAPKDMAEAKELFRKKMGWASVRNVGGLDRTGLNPLGDTVIDPQYETEHCDSVVESVKVHESAHRWYYVARSIPIAMMGPRGLAKVLTKSEIAARDDQERFLKGELAALRKRCADQGRDYTSRPRDPTNVPRPP